MTLTTHTGMHTGTHTGWPNPADDRTNGNNVNVNSNIDIETELPMNIHAPINEIDELDPDPDPDPERARPPDEPTVRAPVARCADGNGTMTGLFFSDHVVDIARAKAMCALCPLAQACLAGALEREEPWGVWGGVLLSGGRVVADKRPCGRPPKHPRPEIVYDEMGPVGAVLTVA